MVEVICLSDKDSPSVEVKCRLFSTTTAILEDHWQYVEPQTRPEFIDFLIDLWYNRSNENGEPKNSFLLLIEKCLRHIVAGRPDNTLHLTVDSNSISLGHTSFLLRF
jgi:hypothetical protein